VFGGHVADPRIDFSTKTAIWPRVTGLFAQ
jgi:hypothetical protein